MNIHDLKRIYGELDYYKRKEQLGQLEEQDIEEIQKIVQLFDFLIDIYSNICREYKALLEKSKKYVKK